MVPFAYFHGEPVGPIFVEFQVRREDRNPRILAHISANDNLFSDHTRGSWNPHSTSFILAPCLKMDIQWRGCLGMKWPKLNWTISESQRRAQIWTMTSNWKYLAGNWDKVYSQIHVLSGLLLILVVIIIKSIIFICSKHIPTVYFYKGKIRI